MITPLYLLSKGTGPRLRVAVLLDGWTLPGYVATILEDIGRCNFADIELAVVVASTSPTLATLLPGLAHELYLRVDRVMGGDSDPLAPVEGGACLSGVDRLDVKPGGPGQPWLAPDVMDEIRRRDLDVILRFCAARPHGEVLRAARCGVWSYHYGAEEDGRDGTPFFQQHAARAPTRDVQLEVLEEEPGANLVLCRSRFGTGGNVFLAHYRQAPFWETTHFVVWKLHDLHELGWEHVRDRAAAPVPAAGAAGRAPTPSNAEMVKYLASRLGTAVVNRARADHRPHNPYRLGLRHAVPPFGTTPESTSLEGFRWVGAPGHAWADPFIFEHGGTKFLFFEDFDFERGYGTIRRAEVRSDCSLGVVSTSIDPGYHLSFPFVFEHQGEVFMIPESLANGTVTLYRARRFPDEWLEEKVLFRGNATDTTLWRQGPLFYFFTSLHDRDDRGMKTMLFVADSLTGDWSLHPASPVSSDVREARNAGAIFRRQGRLFRPTQNCGPRYGYGFNLREITALSEDAFEERPWCSVDPSALPFRAIGVHTYNCCGDYEVIDAHVRGD
ncbi:MAG TPA: hypothetical protein VGL81_31360 [Polyangiaceae bacterium]|jgi:hypothetical protein